MIIFYLFWAFFIANLLGYGGGPASIPLNFEEVVQHFHWLSKEEFSNMLALANAAARPDRHKNCVLCRLQRARMARCFHCSCRNCASLGHRARFFAQADRPLPPVAGRQRNDLVGSAGYSRDDASFNMGNQRRRDPFDRHGSITCHRADLFSRLDEVPRPSGFPDRGGLRLRRACHSAAVERDVRPLFIK